MKSFLAEPNLLLRDYQIFLLQNWPINFPATPLKSTQSTALRVECFGDRQ